MAGKTRRESKSAPATVKSEPLIPKPLKRAWVYAEAYECDQAGRLVPSARQPPETCLSRPSQYGARSLNFCNFPVAVRARESRNSTEVGHLK